MNLYMENGLNPMAPVFVPKKYVQEQSQKITPQFILSDLMIHMKEIIPEGIYEIKQKIELKDGRRKKIYGLMIQMDDNNRYYFFMEGKELKIEFHVELGRAMLGAKYYTISLELNKMEIIRKIESVIRYGFPMKNNIYSYLYNSQNKVFTHYL